MTERDSQNTIKQKAPSQVPCNVIFNAAQFDDSDINIQAHQITTTQFTILTTEGKIVITRGCKDRVYMKKNDSQVSNKTKMAVASNLAGLSHCAV